MIIRTLTFIILSTLPLRTHANEPVSAIAMHGTSPMNESDFTHLPYTNPNATKGATLTQCSIGTFDTLNDNTMKGKAAEGLHMLNDPLMRRVWSEPFGLYGVIAKDVILPDDRSSITFNLNPNAIFHDGSRITTADIQFSFEQLRDKGKPNTRNVYRLVKNVDVKNDTTIRFDFGESYNQETALILAMMPIYSKAYWQDREFDKTTLDIPLGSGPYKIKSIDEGRKITYEKVTDYWAKNNPVHIGHYNFDHMTFDYYRDEQVALEAFKSGDCDVRREFNPAKWQINYDDNGDYVREELSHSRPEPARGFIMNTRRAPLNNIKVREALSLAFDFNWMNKTLFHGKAKRVNSIFSNTELKSNFSFNNKNKRKNLKQANKSLNSSEWILKDGKRFELSLILNNPAEEKIALAYARDLKRLGIILNIRVLDTAQFFGALNDYDYDLVSWRWINSLSPGTEQNVYWGCEAANTKGSRNYSGVCNPEIEITIENLADAKTYEHLRLHAQKLDSQIMNQYLFIPHYYTGVDYVVRQPRIKHPAEQSTYGMVLETWWSEQ